MRPRNYTPGASGDSRFGCGPDQGHGLGFQAHRVYGSGFSKFSIIISLELVSAECPDGSSMAIDCVLVGIESPAVMVWGFSDCAQDSGFGV